MKVKTFIKGKVCVRLYNCYFFLLLLKTEKKKRRYRIPQAILKWSLCIIGEKFPYDLRNELKEPIYDS